MFSCVLALILASAGQSLAGPLNGRQTGGEPVTTVTGTVPASANGAPANGDSTTVTVRAGSGAESGPTDTVDVERAGATPAASADRSTGALSTTVPVPE